MQPQTGLSPEGKPSSSPAEEEKDPTVTAGWCQRGARCQGASPTSSIWFLEEKTSEERNQLLLSIGLALRAVHLQLPAALSSPGAESLPLPGLDQIGC